MAMSLEDLLADEGFNRGRSKMMMPRKSLPSEAKAKSMQLYQLPPRDQHKTGSSSGVRKTERTKSDIPRYHLRGEFQKINKVKARKPKDNNVRQGIESRMEIGQKHERRSSQDLKHVKNFSTGSSADLSGFEIIDIATGNEIVEVGLHENGVYNDVYSNETYSHEGSEAKYDSRSEESGRYQPQLEKDTVNIDKKFAHCLTKKKSMYKSFNDPHKKRMKQPETSYRSSQNSKSFDDNKGQTKADIEQNAATPALDEAAIKAMISILNGYVKRFIKDEDFRASQRHSSFASLNFVAIEDGLNTESKVIANLEDAIEIVERAAEERVSVKDLKKASLQLSVITGLNSNDLKDGYTSGIPNYRLSACAHLYLSVIYKLQKKDRIAAKHLLQVFCDSPFQARTTLLPELWDQIFFPHLIDLKVWYSKEADSLANSPSKARKLKLLEKVYNEIVDSSTRQFAVYYKDWLNEGVEAPILPSIQIPSIPVQLVQEEDLGDHSLEKGSPVGSLLSQPMVSKKLYDAVFRHSVRLGSEMVDCEEESFEISASSSHSVALEENSSSEIVKRTVPYNKPVAASRLEIRKRNVEAKSSCEASSSEKVSPNEKSCNCHMRVAPAYPNEEILKRLVKVVFEQQQPDHAVHASGILSLHSREVLLSNSVANNFHRSVEESQENSECSNGGSLFSSIPQDFLCPLTELLFEDPVTLETGQTFERSAIANWFEKGNRTCPVTGKTLECQSVPSSNFILKRVVDNWKLDYCRHLMELASQVGKHMESKDEIAVFILEQLLVASTEEERIITAKQIISLGGLQFLIRRFQYGNPEERTRISTLLLSCIHANANCKNYVSMNINRLSLLDLLHSKQLKSRASAVLLLTELICLNRRKDAKYFLDGLQREEMTNALHVLLTYLQTCRHEQRPQVAVLILHLDLLVEPQKYSIFREESVDAITMALESSLSNEEMREQCCRALLVLGGHISSAGKIMTEDWILKQAGFLDCPVFYSPDNSEANVLTDESIAMMVDVDEEKTREKWLVNLSSSLLGDGSKSFLKAISWCLVSGYPDLVRVCLTTVAWLSSALASLPDAEFQLSAFSALISGLKMCLDNAELVEHRILASMSLLNFSRFPECRLLLMTMAEDIAFALESLAEVTWTAKELYAMICTH